MIHVHTLGMLEDSGSSLADALDDGSQPVKLGPDLGATVGRTTGHRFAGGERDRHNRGHAVGQ
jgi:hypothetical protein